MKNVVSLIYSLCFASCMSSVVSSGVSIVLQLRNYRKPFEQRLIVRILVVVPLFAISCYCVTVNYKIGNVLEPIREIYEAFVIYTFYKLLVQMLGGERQIIQMTVDKQPTAHPFPMNLVLKKVHISDPLDFLTIKRLILQYVWMKPLIYISIFLTSILGLYDIRNISISNASVWIGLIYNISVTLSLYNLAMFWKCLYEELKPFNPWKKFLCVKLIIFASYWQGLFIGLMSWLGMFDKEVSIMGIDNLNNRIQNGLLCSEMIFFAWMHWNSFPYTDFTPNNLDDCGRIKTWIAFKDCFCFNDLIYDIKMTTINGDSYNLRNFDSKTDSNVYMDSQTFNKKIYQGLRMSSDGKKYWINGVTNDYNETNQIPSSNRRKSLSGSIDSHLIVVNSKTPLIDNVNNDQQRMMANHQSFNYLSNAMSKQSHNAYYDNKNSIECNDDIDTRRGGITNFLRPQRFDNEFRESDQTNEEEEEAEEDNKEGFAKDEKLYRYVKQRYPPEREINYPVEYEYQLFNHSNRIEMLRRTIYEDVGA